MPIDIRSSERNKSSASSRVIIECDCTQDNRSALWRSLVAAGGHRRLHGLYENVDSEDRLGFALTPSIQRPLGSQVGHVGMVAQIDHDLVGSAVEFLRKD